MSPKPDLSAEQWFVFHAINNYAPVSLADEIMGLGLDCYVPTKLDNPRLEAIPGLFFVRCEWRSLAKVRKHLLGKAVEMFEDGEPLVVRDSTIEDMKLLYMDQTSQPSYLRSIDDILSTSKLVRFTMGPLKGLYGYLKRIHRSRHILYDVDGVALLSLPGANYLDCVELIPSQV